MEYSMSVHDVGRNIGLEHYSLLSPIVGVEGITIRFYEQGRIFRVGLPIHVRETWVTLVKRYGFLSIFY